MTTARQAYEAILIELNKENAPNLLLEDFNYLFNKAIYQYTNKRYNIYDINQQTTDDLRVLKATALLPVTKAYPKYEGTSQITDSNPTDEIFGFLGATYEAILPSDYYHILNCICIYKVNKTFKCYNAGDYWRRAATRLTADLYSQVLDNFYVRPTYKRPYYYIHNVNQQTENPTNSYSENQTGSTDANQVSENTRYKYVKKSTFNSNIIKNTSDGWKYYSEEKLNHDWDTVENYSRAIYWTLKEGNLQGKIKGPSENLYNDTNISTAYNIIQFYDDSKYYYTTGTTEVGKAQILEFDEDQIDKSKFTKYYDKVIEVDQDSNKNSIVISKGLPTSIDLKSGDSSIKASNIERSANIRYGNKSQVRLEIRYGSDDSLFTLEKVYVDYLKTPQNIRLTQAQLDKTEDTSQILEFPDYVCQEIINELVHIIMENISDQRIQTHPVVSQSIANPAQAQTEPVAQSQ